LIFCHIKKDSKEGIDATGDFAKAVANTSIAGILASILSLVESCDGGNIE
jgi:hypothetical protein